MYQQLRLRTGIIKHIASYNPQEYLGAPTSLFEAWNIERDRLSHHESIAGGPMPKISARVREMWHVFRTWYANGPRNDMRIGVEYTPVSHTPSGSIHTMAFVMALSILTDIGHGDNSQLARTMAADIAPILCNQHTAQQVALSVTNSMASDMHKREVLYAVDDVSKNAIAARPGHQYTYAMHLCASACSRICIVSRDTIPPAPTPLDVVCELGVRGSAEEWKAAASGIDALRKLILSGNCGFDTANAMVASVFPMVSIHPGHAIQAAAIFNQAIGQTIRRLIAHVEKDIEDVLAMWSPGSQTLARAASKLAWTVAVVSCDKSSLNRTINVPNEKMWIFSGSHNNIPVVDYPTNSDQIDIAYSSNPIVNNEFVMWCSSAGTSKQLFPQNVHTPFEIVALCLRSSTYVPLNELESLDPLVTSINTGMARSLVAVVVPLGSESNPHTRYIRRSSPVVDVLERAFPQNAILRKAIEWSETVSMWISTVSRMAISKCKASGMTERSTKKQTRLPDHRETQYDLIAKDAVQTVVETLKKLGTPIGFMWTKDGYDFSDTTKKHTDININIAKDYFDITVYRFIKLLVRGESAIAEEYVRDVTLCYYLMTVSPFDLRDDQTTIATASVKGRMAFLALVSCPIVRVSILNCTGEKIVIDGVNMSIDTSASKRLLAASQAVKTRSMFGGSPGVCLRCTTTLEGTPVCKLCHLDNDSVRIIRDDAIMIAAVASLSCTIASACVASFASMQRVFQQLTQGNHIPMENTETTTRKVHSSVEKSELAFNRKKFDAELAATASVWYGHTTTKSMALTSGFETVSKKIIERAHAVASPHSTGFMSDWIRLFVFSAVNQNPLVNDHMHHLCWYISMGAIGASIASENVFGYPSSSKKFRTEFVVLEIATQGIYMDVASFVGGLAPGVMFLLDNEASSAASVSHTSKGPLQRKRPVTDTSASVARKKTTAGSITTPSATQITCIGKQPECIVRDSVLSTTDAISGTLLLNPTQIRHLSSTATGNEQCKGLFFMTMATIMMNGVSQKQKAVWHVRPPTDIVTPATVDSLQAMKLAQEFASLVCTHDINNSHLACEYVVHSCDNTSSESAPIESICTVPLCTTPVNAFVGGLVQTNPANQLWSIIKKREESMHKYQTRRDKLLTVVNQPRIMNRVIIEKQNRDANVQSWLSHCPQAYETMKAMTVDEHFTTFVNSNLHILVAFGSAIPKFIYNKGIADGIALSIAAMIVLSSVGAIQDMHKDTDYLQKIAVDKELSNKVTTCLRYAIVVGALADGSGMVAFAARAALIVFLTDYIHRRKNTFEYITTGQQSSNDSEPLCDALKIIQRSRIQIADAGDACLKSKNMSDDFSTGTRIYAYQLQEIPNELPVLALPFMFVVDSTIGKVTLNDILAITNSELCKFRNHAATVCPVVSCCWVDTTPYHQFPGCVQPIQACWTDATDVSPKRTPVVQMDTFPHHSNPMDHHSGFWSRKTEVPPTV